MKKLCLMLLFLLLTISQALAGFGGYLKADTQTNVTIGPAVAVGDGYTPVTNLDVSTADEAEIIKHSGTTVTDISGNTMTAITNADGYYYLVITAGQLDTEGRLTVLINDDSLALPLRIDFEVVNANVYDSLYAAATTDYLQVDTIQIGGTTQSATDLKDFADAGYDPATNKVQGVVLTDTCTTLTDHTAQSGDNYARLGAPAGASIAADIAAIEGQTDDIGAAGAGLTAVPWNSAWDAEAQSECADALNAYDPPTKAEMDSGFAGLNDISAADVNAQVSDVIKTDTISEMSQGAPPGSPTMEQAVNYLYKAWRNKNMTDSSTIEIYNDAGSTVLFKSNISDDGTDFTKGEYVSGP